ncbi:MAG: D-2-hydroxyacid dehydrogenase [Ruminococcaceae bacterium]|nr:D-2-hydroxyacid dehydrogenase [Oscillospiraceae bacterium]
MKTVILDAKALNPGDLSWDDFRTLGELDVYQRTDPQDVVKRAKCAEIVITNKVVIGKNEMEQLPECKYIGILATGYNVVDIEEASKRGITVTNVPAYSTDSVAQLVFALLLENEHRVARHNELSHGAWEKHDMFCLYESPLFELSGKTFGIFGYGSIGTAVAKIANAFGMRVLCYSRTKKADDTVTWVDKETLFRESDYLSLHCPLTPLTDKLINNDTIALMKKSAVIINTTRGGTVDEQAVASALSEGRIRAFLADVLSTEPPKPTNPLLKAPNCLITPHIAWATIEARSRLMKEAFLNAQAYTEGKKRNVIEI